MKVLSLYQPWATLVVIGAKRFETRSWATKYRGSLLIHASKRFPFGHKLLCEQNNYFAKALSAWSTDALPTGAIIGRVDLVDCIATEDWLKQRGVAFGRQQFCILTDINNGGDVFLTPEAYREYTFGSYDGGRFAWQLQNPVEFDEPISARGSLGIWEFPESALGHLANETAGAVAPADER